MQTFIAELIIRILLSLPLNAKQLLYIFLSILVGSSRSDNILLGLITCIETFLTPRDGGPVTTAIAESIAIIGGKDLASRKRLKKKVKGLYRLRSRISHGGKKAILDADLAALRQITAGLTMTMIQKRNDFETITAFLEWIEDQKLS